MRENSAMRVKAIVGRVGLLLLLGTSLGAAATPDTKIAPWLLQKLTHDGPQSFFVVLREQVPQSVVDSFTPGEQYARLTAVAARTQPVLTQWLGNYPVRVTSFWIVNGLLVEGGDLSLARSLALRDDVARVEGNPRVHGLPTVTRDDLPNSAPSQQATMSAPGLEAATGTAAAGDAVEWGVTMVRAPSVWSTFNKRGEGVVVATLDTGVQWDHPALKQHYRGWNEATQTADHSFSWHDAVENGNAPLDDNDHGTHVTGTMVGDDGNGNQIGVAPGAKFIACRNMDHGNGTPALYLDCLEWVLAPYPANGDKFRDGRPDLAPNVANNSWGCPPSEGCSALTLQSAFARQREAGILQIAAAGNSGPSCSTVQDPPAIYDELFSVGAVDQNRTIAGFSSRGPVTIDGSNRRKPNASAPGDGVRSSVPIDGYAVFSGTSMASPHVAGVSALILSVRPQLRGAVSVVRCMLEQAATHNVGSNTPQTCGGLRQNQYPNNSSGAGLVDALGTLQLTDGDNDGVSNACDCAATNGGAYAIPGRVRGLSFVGASKSLLKWDTQANAAGTGTRYDLIRGDVATLLGGGGSVSSAECLVRDLSSPLFNDPLTPASGAAVYYLARAKNSCGDGGFGASSSGTNRINTACN